MNWICVAIVLMMAHKEFMASPTPLKLPGHTRRLTPYIKHWEAANFDRAHLHDAHQKHIEQKRHRRKRDLNAGEYGPAHTIRLNFFAHDREFRLVLRQNPLSVFASDVQIENTLGPMDYDISRIYTGLLEDDENSHVHAILTHDNLLDGTIETSSEHYYVEPSHRYSRDLPQSGVHSIVYKVSDVNAKPKPTSASTTLSESEHCASERLRRSMLHHRSAVLAREDNINRTGAQMFSRRKRWLPDEFSASGNVHQDPPLPLDLDVPYNDDFSIFRHDTNHGGISGDNDEDKSRIENNQQDRNTVQQSSVITWRNVAGSNNGNAGSERKRDRFTPSLVATSTTTKSTRNRNIIVNNYNPNSADDSGNSNSNSNSNNYNNNNNNNARKTYTKHKNIIVSTYNINNNNNNNNNNNSSHRMYYDQQDANLSDSSDNKNNNFFNTNWTTMFVGGNDRPSHKTHVEIITKNGATKKPNIIVNNYNPEIMMAPNPHNPNFNSMLMTNLLSGRGQDTNHDTATGGGSGSSRSMYDRKITCMLYLQADHTFFQKMGSDEASIEAITRHVQRANSIYKNTDFNNDGKPDNITFMIKRIKVHNMNAVKDPAYRFPGNYGVEKFLELFSEEDYDAFCLAYMFTYRDFEMGTLGLAWTGDLKNAGGVCEKNGHYRGSLKSLNTGIVTLLNYGKHVPPAVSHVTLAHEIGHNFGSPHDPEQCTPGGEDGNFIMFARATSGDKKNNNKFSPCSLKSIEPVLNAKARSTKGCFTEPQTSICGNGVVEPGEQCDCGWEEDCKDLCCFPMSRHPRIDEKPCTLTPHSMCSPSQGPCCTTDCKLKFGYKCRDDNGCRDPSFCDGRMPQCPPSINKPNKTICNKEFVCYMGDCTGSICLAYGLESCQCIPGPNDDKIKSCELCCKLPGEGNPCRSSFEWNEPPFDVPDMYAKPGTPCNDYNGYCDVFQKCREVDPSGPLATLRKLLLSEESIATFKKWIQHNWYTVALAAIGVFVLLILSTKLLAKRSNLKLKSVTIIHSATTETVRLPDDNNGVIVHTAVRTKVPFKKKVRGERSNKNKSSNNNGGNNSKSKNSSGSRATKSGVKSIHIYNRGGKVTSPTTVTAPTAAAALAATSAEVKKPARSKKNRIAGANLGATTTAVAVAAVGATAVNVNEKSVFSDSKKTKKFKKHCNKEIIDYSSRNGTTVGSTAGTHTNTFGKVQKWLLESPIVAQPLSHIEHSSKVRKVMSKSQSTPERLVQKSPQKTKSMGNLSNEKVKLQVVYKPPFKFSLRLSKSTKVKTHVISGGGGGSSAVNKLKRQPRTSGGGNDNKRSSNNQISEGSKSSNSEKTKRAALLLLSNNDNEDNQILTLSEPNYETLNSKSTSKLENPFYENMQYTQGDDEGEHSVDRVCGAATNAFKISRSSSKTNLDAAAASQSQRQHSYSRSNSLSANNPFAVAAPPIRSSRKLSETNSQTNLSRNFGSTQNLINSSQSNLAKSKKRSSLNLKSSISKNGKDPPPPNLQHTKRSSSSSNMHLRRDSSSSNLPGQKLLQEASNHSSTATGAASPNAKQHHSQHQQPLRRSSSSMAHHTQPQQLSSTAVSAAATAVANSTSISSQQQHQLAPYTAQRSSRASSSNIPRASLSSNNTPANINNNNLSNFSSSSNRQTPASASATTTAANFNTNSSHGSGSSGSNNARTDHRRSRSGNAPPSSASTASSAHRSNSIRQHAHNYHPPPLPYPAAATVDIEHELPSDLEVMVSDVENLVS